MDTQEYGWMTRHKPHRGEMMGLMQSQSLEYEMARYMPNPEWSDAKDTEGTYAVQHAVSNEMIEHEEHLKYVWLDMFHKASMNVAMISLSLPDDRLVIKYKPYVHRDIWETILGLRLEITIVQTVNVVMPEFIYEPHSNKLIEFRCGHCTTPNPIERTTCSQCGAPRAKLIQEM